MTERTKCIRLLVVGLCALAWIFRGETALAATGGRPSFSASPSDAEIRRAIVFEEPLVPLGPTTGKENRALGDSLQRHVTNERGRRPASLEGFLRRYPRSGWRASLLLNIGFAYRGAGYISRALGAWEEAWELSKAATDKGGKATANRALAEYAGLLARLGRTDELAELMEEVRSRPVGGAAAERLVQAADGLSTMRARPEIAFRCGPYALDRVLASLRDNYTTPRALEEFPSTERGTSLSQVSQLAKAVGNPMQMALRSPGAPLVTPAIVHWKSGHFAALVREVGGRYLVEDGTFGDRHWVSRDAVEDEASGYAAVPIGSLPAGWRGIDTTEGDRVWGRGGTTANNPENYKPSDPKNGCEPEPCVTPPGMAVARGHLMLVSLNIVDEPLGYSPAVGPAVRFVATYNQRESYQPAEFQYMNLGPKWTFDWLTYIDAPSVSDVRLYVGGGGQETYEYDPFSMVYVPHRETRAMISRISDSHYERRMPDGSKMVFAERLGSTTKIFLTSIVDPQGNALTLGYDHVPNPDNLRLRSITDPQGLVTTLDYAPGDDELMVTKVTDPYGRFATMTYTDGRLAAITDVMGMTSEFQDYDPDDFIKTLVTPYGTSSFDKGEVETPLPPSQFIKRYRWLTMTDPLGGRERIEYHSDPGAPHYLLFPDGRENAALVPEGFNLGETCCNNYLDTRNTFYWDKRAMANPVFSYSDARIYHWLKSGASPMNGGTLHSQKKPLENRVWYRYEGGSDNEHHYLAQPTLIGRRLDDGTDQLTSYAYNILRTGKICEFIDPMNRKTRFSYGNGSIPDPATPCSHPNNTGLDLFKVEQMNGGDWDVVRRMTYNDKHQPLEVTDAAGVVTRYTYLPDGRVLTVETPLRPGHDGTALTLDERTTTYEYYPDLDPNAVLRKRLKKITGPSVGTLTGPTTTLTYDDYGRIRTTTDSDNYMLTFDYDALDRLTKTTYPDDTFEQTTYEKLDPEGHLDRLGRWSYTYHDRLRRIKQTKDALNQVTNYNWCTCGSLDSVTDARSQVTAWDRDVLGRVKTETRHDGKKLIFTYEDTTSRLKSIVDPLQQERRFTYAKDDRLTGITYLNEGNPTTDVIYGYGTDPYGRLQSVTDGTGTTTFGYHLPLVPGALKTAWIDGPVAGTGDRIEYAYDAIGLVTNRKITGSSNDVSYKFDSLGRLRTETTPIGPFGFAYQGVSHRRETTTYPNTQTTEYSYHPGTGDLRLHEIHNKLPNTFTLSKFTYLYDEAGNVKTWSQQRGSSPTETYDLTYDAVDQLLLGTPTPSGLPTYEDTYDVVGNRLWHLGYGPPMLGSYDSRNRILTYGALTPPIVFAHDHNGNMTAKDSQTYLWDAENRLLQVGTAAGPVSFTYDSSGRRATKTVGSVVTNYIYDGPRLVEERRGTEVIRYFDGPGIDEHLAVQDGAGTVSYLASDHLGSVTDVTSTTGATILSRKYDPWGEMIAGAASSGYAFTGRSWDAETGLSYYRARYYDPKIGRFISEDPISFDGGDVNFYAYVSNNPVNFTDPLGLQRLTPIPTPAPPPPPPPTFRPCPVTTTTCTGQPCTPFTDWTLFWSCMAYNMVKPNNNAAVPTSRTVTGVNIVTVWFQCLNAAQVCVEGGIPCNPQPGGHGQPQVPVNRPPRPGRR